MPVIRDPEFVAIDLRTYGEDAVAARVPELSPEDLQRIYDRADHYLYNEAYATPSGASPLLAWTIAMAAVEVLEGEERPLRW